MRSWKTLRELQPVHLTLYWCDRCSRLINDDEDEHFHPEQCGGCRRYRRVDADWGYCSVAEAPGSCRHGADGRQPPCRARGQCRYSAVKNLQTSSGTQVHGHELEQVFGGVAHELYRSPVPSTTALP